MNYIKVIFLGFLGGIFSWFLILSFPGSGSFVFNLIRSDLVSFLGDEPIPTPTPTIAISPDFWQKITSDHILSTVAVQSFKAGKIVREGSGIVISSDGVVITTFDVVSGTDALQVFYKEKILRAQLVKYDSFKNLALLKVAETNMDVARLDRNYQFQAGQDVVISGKIVELSSPAVFSQRGMVSHIFSKNIVLNTEPNYYISGSKVINNSGVVVGMVFLRSSVPHLIKAEVIDDFIKKYFESIQK